jgi:RecA-family ATPase
VKKFDTVDEEELMNTLLNPIKYVVEGFISEGLSVLAGPPKIGKSWLVLWLADRVAKGEDVWEFHSTSGTVLYLCLEDNDARIQNRLHKIIDEATDNLIFAMNSDTISTGLIEQISNFIDDHSDTKMIIIDTLQKVRDDINVANQYAADYKELNELKAIAYKKHIAIILVHHLRKQKDEDPLNMLSGTTGLVGVVDNIYILDKLKRTSNKAILYATGRDIVDLEIKLLFDKEKLIWIQEEKVDRVEKLGIDEDIVEVDRLFSFLNVEEFIGTATELSDLMREKLSVSITPAILSKKLTRYHEDFRNMGYTYESHRTSKERIIRIKKK